MKRPTRNTTKFRGDGERPAACIMARTSIGVRAMPASSREIPGAGISEYSEFGCDDGQAGLFEVAQPEDAGGLEEGGRQVRGTALVRFNSSSPHSLPTFQWCLSWQVAMPSLQNPACVDFHPH